jgi:hypothetical protein
MKKALRLGALVGIIVLSSWLSTSPRAQAASNCTFLSNRSCSPVGSRVDCIYDGELGGYCTCGLDHRWKCVF